MGITEKTSADQPLTELQQFQRDLLALLEKYQHNRVVDANTAAYQNDLLKTLKQVNKMVASGKLTTKDTKTLEKLINVTERQYDSTKAANAGDKQFQKNFVKVFGTKPLEGSLAKMMVQHMGKSLRQFQQTLSQATAPIAKNAKDTALFGVTGPFGAMAEQAIDWSSIKQHIKQGHQNRVANRQAKQQRLSDQYSSNIGGLNDSIKGIFAGGHSDVPESGSYYIHQGERVVAPEQNKDLSTFLDQVQGRGGPQSSVSSSLMKDIDDNVKRATKLLEVETATGYFDPMIENDDRLFLLGQKDKFRFNKRLFQNLEVLAFGVYGIGNSVTGVFIKFGLKFERFMRHPFFYSADFITKPFQHLFTGLFHEFFPKGKDEETKIYDKLEDIYEFMKDKESKSHMTWGQRLIRHLKDFTLRLPLNVAVKAATLGTGRAYTLGNARRIQEDIEAHGHRHGMKGIMDRLHMIGYGKYLNQGPMSAEARAADQKYGAAGTGRDLRYAFRKPLKAAGVYHLAAMFGVMNEADMKKDGIKIKRKMHDAIKKFQEEEILKPWRHAGALWQRNFVHNAGVLQKNYKKTAGENAAYIHHGIFGAPGQKRDAKGRFLPHQIGLFGHAKNVSKDILHQLKLIHKDAKKNHKGLFGTLLMFGGFLLSGLKNLFPLLLAGLGLGDLGVAGGLGVLLKSFATAVEGATETLIPFKIAEQDFTDIVNKQLAAQGYKPGQKMTMNQFFGGDNPNQIAAKLAAKRKADKPTPLTKKVQQHAMRLLNDALNPIKQNAAGLLHNPYVADAAAVTAIGAGTADYQAHRAIITGKHMYNKNVAPALTNTKTVVEAQSIKVLHQIRDGVDRLTPVVKKSGDDLLRTSKTHIAATLAAAKSNAPAEEEMLMAKVHSWYGYTLGAYNALR